MEGIIPSIEAINGQAMNELGLGRDIALTFLAIFVFNILLARFTKWKYIFLTGQAILWMATMTTVFGYFAGLRGFVLIFSWWFHLGQFCYCDAGDGATNHTQRSLVQKRYCFRPFLYDRLFI